MEKDILYTFFEGTATQQQQEEVRKWMEASPENERTFFKERRLFDMMLLLAQERAGKNKTFLLSSPSGFGIIEDRSSSRYYVGCWFLLYGTDFPE